MLARLQGALDGVDLSKQLVLLPQSHPVDTTLTQDINLVVGYNGSPRSQTALDLTLWIAHQTRLASRSQVMVQVVYVVSLINPRHDTSAPSRQPSTKRGGGKQAALGLDRSTLPELDLGGNRQLQPGSRSRSAIADHPKVSTAPMSTLQLCQTEQFDQADRILWQARHLADEWRGSLKTHLRFGQIAEELRTVVNTEAASLLVLGCEAADHVVVRQLGSRFPCPVLGIPPARYAD
jgi:nucleotide-binding universal stress UspA family protein